MTRVEVYLVPGFLGFRSVKKLSYFVGVEEMLQAKLADRGIDATIRVVDPLPAGSIVNRAKVLVRSIRENHDPSVEHVHLLGHSTGGLDIRLLLSPGDEFDADGQGATLESAGITHKVRTAMGLATPHFGTPIADAFLRVDSDRLLHHLGVLAGNPTAWRALYVGVKSASALSRVGDLFGWRDTWLDWMDALVLRGVSPNPEGDDIAVYLDEVAKDQGALRQLTQESIHIFNASVQPRENVEYVSFLTAAPDDTPDFSIPAIARDPFLWASTQIFKWLKKATADYNENYPYASLSADDRALIEKDLGRLPSEATNDGIVPTLSQVYGRVGGAFVSDHLDVVGMFPHKEGDEEFVGWLRSGAGFDEPRFEALWTRVAETVAQPSGTSR